MHVAPASLHFRHSGDWRSHYITRQLAMIDSNSSKRCILFVSFSSTLHMPEALKSPWVPILTRADVSVIGPARLAEVLRGLDTAGGVAEHQALMPRRTSSGHGPMLSLPFRLHSYPTLAHIHPHNTDFTRRSDLDRPGCTADSIIRVRYLEDRKSHLDCPSTPTRVGCLRSSNQPFTIVIITHQHHSATRLCTQS